MTLSPASMAVLVFELALLIGGAVLLVRVWVVPELRKKWFETNKLLPWPITGWEVLLLVILIFLTGTFVQSVAQFFLGGWLARVEPLAMGTPAGGARIIVYGAGFHTGSLLGWLVFGWIRRAIQPEIGAPLPEIHAPAYRHPVLKVAVAAGSAMLVAMPLLALTGLVWTLVLEAAGLPATPQDLLGIFTKTKSPAIFAGLLFVACVLAPASEELLFRRGIYRYLRQRFGRALALLVSSVLFGALHANWASFAQLAVLGTVFALAYEKTGDIRVPIVAHALFNLNTVLLLFSGLPL